MENPELDLQSLVAKLLRANCDFVVIGSSALALREWDVSPADLDVMTLPELVGPIIEALGIGDGEAEWVEDGAARRLECQTQIGLVDIYVEVSNGLSYGAVVRDAAAVRLEGEEAGVRVGSIEHVRDMRAAAGRDLSPREASPPPATNGAPRIVAIDGPAGAGKSTVSRAVARRLGLTYLNTGAMYRCVALAVLRQKADTDDHKAIGEIAEAAEIESQEDRVLLNGHDVSDEIRDDHVAEVTSHISAYREVREAMVSRQRRLFARGGFVVEGRDTGTVVAPGAPLKVYLTASLRERARRRSLQTGEGELLVQGSLSERDHLDSKRELSALRIADDAVEVDTTGRSVDDVVDEIEALARERGIA
jgi:cytidylate kinase